MRRILTRSAGINRDSRVRICGQRGEKPKERFLATLGMTEIRTPGLLDDDADEFFLASSEKKFGWLGKVDVLAKIVYALLVDFDSSLLD